MARETIIRDYTMEAALWLIFNRDGSVRMTRGRPDCSRDERALALTVKLPLVLFATPTLSATLTIDDPGVPAQQIDVAAASEALRGALGCDIDVVVREVTND